MAFMTFVQRHNLNYACQPDLLKLFSIILPSPSSVSSSSYMLTNNFFKYEEDVVTQHYCGSCMSLLRQSTNPQKGLQRAVFVRSKQLEERFAIYSVYYILTLDPDFGQLIQHRFNRVRKPGVVSDVYDGSEHSEYFQSKFFCFEFRWCTKV